MRVAVVGPTDADSFADNVADTLRRMGHDALAAGAPRHQFEHRKVDAAVKVVSDLVSSFDVRLQQRVVRAVRDFAPDLTINVDVKLRPSVVAALRESAPIVLWFPDAVANLGRHEAFLAPYDRFYFKIGPTVRQLAGIHGLPARYLPEAANSYWHRSTANYGTDPHIVVAGNLHPTRVILLDRLLADGIPLRIYGPRLSTWIESPAVAAAHSGRSIHRQEKANVFRSARGVLNNLHPAELAGSNCRLFEATGCGAATITEWRDGMDTLFDRGTEVLSYDTYDELVETCRRLLADPVHGALVGDRAARRTHSEHTYEHRIAQVFDDLGLD